MASPPQSPPPAAAAAAKSAPPPPAPTTISALSDDLLREIFLRLPCLRSLVPAALTCGTFLHAVRSSTVFRRRFDESHPPPLFTLFFDPDSPFIFKFAPFGRRSDPDLVATSPGWVLCDCRDGFLLVLNGIKNVFGACNPLTRVVYQIPQAPEEIFDGSHGHAAYLDSFILSTGQDGGPLRVVNVCYDKSRARAAVFSSDSMEWKIFPWSEDVKPDYGDKHWLKAGTMVNGIVYWQHTRDVYMLLLNTRTLEFSQMDLPPFFEELGLRFRVGETKDGKLCMVNVFEFGLFLWYWRSDDDGVEKWMLDRQLLTEENMAEAEITEIAEIAEQNVLAIISGFVYFSISGTGTYNDVRLPCRFLSLCLETGEVVKSYKKKFDSHYRPYPMAWPPSLVHHKVHPQVEGA